MVRPSAALISFSTGLLLSLNCRKRRIKCDEKKPCGYCTRRGLECKQPDFIVHQLWSQSDTSPLSSQENTKSNHEPTTTYEAFYEAFQQAQSTDQGRRSRYSSPRVITTNATLQEETAELLRIYQQGIGTWMDILDHSLTFQREVLRCALSSPLLLHAICALSAKQMSLTEDESRWEPIASQHYGESLGLLIRGLTLEETSRDIILSATIFLCSYELLTLPGTDYQRHLFGGRTLIEAAGNAEFNISNLDRASFWIYARQDVSLALIHECPTLIPPREWPALPPTNDKQEDNLAKRILWLLARVIEFKFTRCNDTSPRTLEGLISTISEMDAWWEGVPSYARGIEVEDESGSEFTQTWFYVPSAGQILPP